MDLNEKIKRAKEKKAKEMVLDLETFLNILDSKQKIKVYNTWGKLYYKGTSGQLLDMYTMNPNLECLYLPFKEIPIEEVYPENDTLEIRVMVSTSEI